MNCQPLSRPLRRQLDDTLSRLIDSLAVDTAKYVQDGELTTETLTALMARAITLGNITAVRDHDDVARAQERTELARRRTTQPNRRRG